MFIAFGLFLLVLLVGGTLWGIRHFQNKYSAAEPITFPEVTTAWQQGTAEAEEEQPQDMESEPTAEAEPQQAQPAEQAEDVEMQAADVQARWRAFEKAADRNQKARIHLGAEEINALLNNSRNTRGKAHVAIRDDVGYVRVSIPLDNMLKNAGWAQSILGVQGRFLNGEATVQASPDGDPAKAQVSNVKIANEAVSDEWLDRQIFGMQSVRSLIRNWLTEQDIQSFYIRQNRVYAETRGQ